MKWIRACLTRISPRNWRTVWIWISHCFYFLTFDIAHHVDYAPNSFITSPTYCIPRRPQYQWHSCTHTTIHAC